MPRDGFNSYKNFAGADVFELPDAMSEVEVRFRVFK